jgi:hypothetical protein
MMKAPWLKLHIWLGRGLTARQGLRDRLRDRLNHGTGALANL